MKSPQADNLKFLSYLRLKDLKFPEKNLKVSNHCFHIESQKHKASANLQLLSLRNFPILKIDSYNQNDLKIISFIARHWTHQTPARAFAFDDFLSSNSQFFLSLPCWLRIGRFLFPVLSHFAWTKRTKKNFFSSQQKTVDSSCTENKSHASFR